MKPYIIAIMDLLWGDNGKGRATHDVLLRLLARRLKVVIVRALGGANAGHETVTEDGIEHKRHLLGSAFEPDVPLVVGAGTVIWPRWLLAEIKDALEVGIKPQDILISDLASLTMPWHRLEEKLREEALRNKKIGTTGRGIGTTYEAKARRTDNVRLYFLQRPDWPKNYQELRTEALDRLVNLYGKPATREKQLKPFEQGFIADCRELLSYIASAIRIQEVYSKADVILLEGNQGMGLDHDFGTVPFVTATGTTGMMQAHGAMLPRVDFHLFVMRGGYTARVGNGPFPSEVFGEKADALRNRGKEFGTTTGRPRRVGYFDLLMPKRALALMGAQLLPSESVGLALTKIDVVDDWSEIPIVTHYLLDGQTIDCVPIDTNDLFRCQPILTRVSGWQQGTTRIKSYSDLPLLCREFAILTAHVLGLSLHLVTCGPRPSNALFVDNNNLYF